MRLGICTPSLAESTCNWVAQCLPLDKVKSNDWLYSAYHAYDYFIHVEDFPDVEVYRKAIIANIIALAESAPPEQYYQFFLFASSPDCALAKATPPKLLKKMLNTLQSSQQDDGAWHDQHNLPHWYTWTTLVVLNALKNYQIWKPAS